MSEQPTTAIVVTYFTGPRLKECLYALIGCPEVTGIVIVDNGNPAQVSAWLREFSSQRDDVRLLEPGENLGFGRAINLAVEAAPDGELLMVNPDAVIKRDAIREMRAVAVRAARPWIIGGKIFDINGHEGRGGRRRKLTLWRALTSSAGFDTWNLNNQAEPDHALQVGAVSGALMLMDTQGFKALSGFDEAYFLHVEDVDLCRRAWEAGGEVLYTPAAGALHYGSTSDVSSKVIARHKADSLVHYFRKNAANAVEKAFINVVLAPLLKWLLPLRAKD